MRPYQRSLLDQQEAFMPLTVKQDHPMMVLSKNLDWDLMQVIGETKREEVVKTNRGLKPHYRALNGAIVVRTIENSNYRKTEDLIRHYMPARYLCDLQNSQWTPDHVAIWEYEGMLGEEGYKELEEYILRTVAGLGFADIRGLCSDTTAQEANIPYPTEVGHMSTFMKSVKANIETLFKNGKGLGKKVIGKVGEIVSKASKKVRSHRLFAKTKEAKNEIEEDIKILTQQALNQLGKFLSNLDVKENQIKGMGLRALNNLSENYQNMCQMMSQIAQWIETGKVAKNKILSLFNTQFRSINRGKAGKKIEFGLKWGINQIRGGYVSIFMHSDMMCHDANYAVLGVQEHIRIFGSPPKDFAFDRAAWSVEHRKEIKKLGVKNLAIAPKGKGKWEVGPRVKDRMVRERAQIEGKIGTMKRYGLNRSEASLNSRVRLSALKAGLCLILRRFAKDLAQTMMAQKTQAAA
jgi:hypothetical protein